MTSRIVRSLTGVVPSARKNLWRAASTSWKTMASAVRFAGQPFVRIVRWRMVANLLSMGILARPRFGPKYY
jgi:hypothetical protein